MPELGTPSPPHPPSVPHLWARLLLATQFCISAAGSSQLQCCRESREGAETGAAPPAPPPSPSYPHSRFLDCLASSLRSGSCNGLGQWAATCRPPASPQEVGETDAHLGHRLPTKPGELGDIWQLPAGLPPASPTPRISHLPPHLLLGGGFAVLGQGQLVGGHAATQAGGTLALFLHLFWGLGERGAQVSESLRPFPEVGRERGPHKTRSGGSLTVQNCPSASTKSSRLLSTTSACVSANGPRTWQAAGLGSGQVSHAPCSWRGGGHPPRQVWWPPRRQYRCSPGIGTAGSDSSASPGGPRDRMGAGAQGTQLTPKPSPARSRQPLPLPTLAM